MTINGLKLLLNAPIQNSHHLKSAIFPMGNFNISGNPLNRFHTVSELSQKRFASQLKLKDCNELIGKKVQSIDSVLNSNEMIKNHFLLHKTLFEKKCVNPSLIFEMLKNQGAILDHTECKEGSYLHEVLKSTYNAVLKFQLLEAFIKAGCDVNATNNKSESLLYSIVESSNLENLTPKAIGLLFKNGCKLPLTQNHNGDCLLHTVIKNRMPFLLKKQVINILIQHGININDVNQNNETPLDCVNPEWEKLYSFLTQLGALTYSRLCLIKFVNCYTEIPIAELNRCCDDELKSKLLENILDFNCDINARIFQDNHTLLYKSIFDPRAGNSIEMTEFLLNSGAKFDNEECREGSYLCEVLSGRFSTEKKLKLLDLLIEHGCDLLQKNANNKSILHHAIFRARLDMDVGIVLDYLFSKGAVENPTDCQEGTLLHDLVSFNISKTNKFQATESLIKHGYNINAVNNQGETPYDLVLRTKNPIIAESLAYRFGAVSAKSLNPMDWFKRALSYSSSKFKNINQ
ncbi:MAG: hypothetical protein JHC93_08650 [Parachlamydiales bacterium]|nr:hypothetical protein [Parachlamydiales bacterium]